MMSIIIFKIFAFEYLFEFRNFVVVSLLAPVAQKLQFIAQPTWVDMHKDVCESLKFIQTASTLFLGSIWKSTFETCCPFVWAVGCSERTFSPNSSFSFCLNSCGTLLNSSNRFIFLRYMFGRFANLPINHIDSFNYTSSKKEEGKSNYRACQKCLKFCAIHYSPWKLVRVIDWLVFVCFFGD